MIKPERTRYYNKKRKRDEPEWIVALFVITALIAGWIIKYSIENKMNVFSNTDISVSYPATWIVETDIYSDNPDSGFKGRAEYGSDRILLMASSLLSESLYKTNISLRAIIKPGQFQSERLLFDPLPGILLDLAEEYENVLCNFDIIDNQKIFVDSAPGIRFDYTFVSSSLLDPKGYSIPSIVYGTDYIVPVENTIYVISVRFDEGRAEEEMDFSNKVMKNIRVEARPEEA
jgi:hypothetical protein